MPEPTPNKPSAAPSSGMPVPVRPNKMEIYKIHIEVARGQVNKVAREFKDLHKRALEQLAKETMSKSKLFSDDHSLVTKPLEHFLDSGRLEDHETRQASVLEEIGRMYAEFDKPFDYSSEEKVEDCIKRAENTIANAKQKFNEFLLEEEKLFETAYNSSQDQGEEQKAQKKALWQTYKENLEEHTLKPLNTFEKSINLKELFLRVSENNVAINNPESSKNLADASQFGNPIPRQSFDKGKREFDDSHRNKMRVTETDKDEKITGLKLDKRRSAPDGYDVMVASHGELVNVQLTIVMLTCRMLMDVVKNPMIKLVFAIATLIALFVPDRSIKEAKAIALSCEKSGIPRNKVTAVNEHKIPILDSSRPRV